MAWVEQRKGGVCWLACWKLGGRKVRKSTGVRIKEPGVSPKRLRLLAEHVAWVMERVACGETPADRACAAVRRVAEVHGLGGAVPTLREYIRSFPKLGGPTTQRTRAIAFRRFLEYLGSAADRRIDTIRHAVCLGFVRWLLERVSIKSAMLYKSLISSMFNRAVNVDELMHHNPMHRVNVGAVAAEVNPELGADVIRVQPFTLQEISYMIRSFPAPWADAVAVCWYTAGLRLSDVSLLRWDAVDWEHKRLLLIEKKTRRSRELPLIPELAALLRRLRDAAEADAEYVFPTMAQSYLTSASSHLSRRFGSLLQQHGLVAPLGAPRKGWRRQRRSKSFHSIRHSVVSFLRGGVLFSPDVIRDAVGHASEAVERGYFTASVDSRSRVCSALAAGLLPDASETHASSD